MVQINDKLDEFRAEIEGEILWRQEEISYLKSFLQTTSKERDEYRIRKMLIVMLYSHFEGFIKFGLSNFLKKISDENFLIKNLNCEKLKAAALNDIFYRYENINSKPEIFFKKEYEPEIHLLARRVELLENLSGYQESVASFEKTVINTESNLSYKVLAKNLFKVGIDYGEFKEHEKFIKKLLVMRNSIAHGESKDMIIKEEDYIELEKKTIELMSKFSELIYRKYEKLSSNSKKEK